MNRLIPDFYCKSIFDVPVTFFEEHNIKYVFSDLDNTLDAYDIYYPTPRVFKLNQDLKNKNIELVVISNNKESRVKNYCVPLNIKYLHHAGKPFPKKVLKFIKDNSIDINQVIFVGDQLMTDVKFAKRAKIKVLLTDVIVSRDQFVTRFNRFFDKIIRKRMKKKGLLQAKEVK